MLMRSAVVFKALVLVALVVFGMTVVFLTYSCQVAGPRLSTYQRENRVRIEGRFLGEYSLGFERVRINESETGAVICDLSGRTMAELELFAGVDTPQTMFAPGASVMFRTGSDSCQLAQGKRYRVTAWGDNGWGNVRPSSIWIRF